MPSPVFWHLVAAALLAADPSSTSSLEAPPAAQTEKPQIVFGGNRVLSDDVYLAVLKLEEWTADAETAATIQRTLAHFLRASGYELSSVHAVAHNNQIHVGINEGRLEKIVWRGRLTVKTLRFTFALELPHEVFNRPALERQVARLSKELDIERTWFVLVPTAQLTHIGPQLESLPAIKGVELLHEREPWELHFFFSENDWDIGAGVDVRSGYADGLELGLNYQGKSWLFDDDRFRVAVSGGAGLRQSLSEEERLYPAFSRATAEGRYYTPGLIGDLRPYLWLRSDLVARQREDLGLENYYAVTGAVSLHIQTEARAGFRVSVGAGGEYRRIWDLTAGPDPSLVPPTVFPHEKVRAFFETRLEWVFDPNNNRTDRRHLLFAEAVEYATLRGVNPWYGYAGYRYQQVITFGWHDLWLKTRGRAHWGDISFHNEESVGEYSHGVFGDRFIRRAVNATAEFRFSVTRDVFKLSLFNEVFAFGDVVRENEDEQPRIGFAIGPGFHALIEGMFQLDFYGSFGVVSGGKGSRFDGSVNALLLKVF